MWWPSARFLTKVYLNRFVNYSYASHLLRRMPCTYKGIRFLNSILRSTAISNSGTDGGKKERGGLFSWGSYLLGREIGSLSTPNRWMDGP